MKSLLNLQASVILILMSLIAVPATQAQEALDKSNTGENTPFVVEVVGSDAAVSHLRDWSITRENIRVVAVDPGEDWAGGVDLLVVEGDRPLTDDEETYIGSALDSGTTVIIRDHGEILDIKGLTGRPIDGEAVVLEVSDDGGVEVLHFDGYDDPEGSKDISGGYEPSNEPNEETVSGEEESGLEMVIELLAAAQPIKREFDDERPRSSIETMLTLGGDDVAPDCDERLGSGVKNCRLTRTYAQRIKQVHLQH